MLDGRGEILIYTEQSAQFRAKREAVEAALAEAMVYHGPGSQQGMFCGACIVSRGRSC